MNVLRNAARGEDVPTTPRWHGQFLFAAQLFFAALLVPTLADASARIPLLTSLPTGLLLLGIAYVYYERRLGPAVVSAVLAGTMWLAVALWRH